MKHKLSETYGFDTSHNEYPLDTEGVTHRLMWLLAFEFIDNEWKTNPDHKRKYPPKELIERWYEGVRR